MLDFAEIGWLETTRSVVREHLFRNEQATSDLLAAIAGGIMTITSITFSLLLLAVQQAAGALTHQVYDQFLRRRVNQVYFGFFVGLALYTLVILATVNPPYNPVFGATMALLLTFVALILMILLLYTTVNQTRPIVVIETIHDHILAAWECQRELRRRTRRAPHRGHLDATRVQATVHGYVVRVDLDILAAAASKARGEIEIVMHVAIGHYVAFQDTLASFWAASPQDVVELALAEVEAAQRILGASVGKLGSRATRVCAES